MYHHPARHTFNAHAPAHDKTVTGSMLDIHSRPVNRDRQPDRQGQIVDPFDLKLRPVFTTIGKLIGYAHTHNRNLTYTFYEENMWARAAELRAAQATPSR